MRVLIRIEAMYTFSLWSRASVIYSGTNNDRHDAGPASDGSLPDRYPSLTSRRFLMKGFRSSLFLVCFGLFLSASFSFAGKKVVRNQDPVCDQEKRHCNRMPGPSRLKSHEFPAKVDFEPCNKQDYHSNKVYKMRNPLKPGITLNN